MSFRPIVEVDSFTHLAFLCNWAQFYGLQNIALEDQFRKKDMFCLLLCLGCRMQLARNPIDSRYCF